MDGSYSRYIHVIHFLGDILFLNVAFMLANLVKFGRFNILSSDHYTQLWLFFNLFWVVVVFLVKLYDIYRVTRLEKIVVNLLRAVFLHILLVFAIIVIQKRYGLSREQILYSYLVFVPLLFAWRFTVLYLLKLYRKAGYNYRNVIIVGANHMGMEMMHFFQSDLSLGYHFLGFFDDEKTEIGNIQIAGKVSDVEEFCEKNEIDEIFCALPLSQTEEISKLLLFADNNLIRFKLIPDFRALHYRRFGFDYFNTVPVLVPRNEPLENVAFRFVKRVFDFVFSLSVITFIFPWLFPLIAILIKLESKGPVFFKQERSGKNNRPFTCWKFRTMRVNNVADELQATKADPRITKLGKFLRKTSIDELPQFFNVLFGDMSVVGPRPHMLKHTEDYSRVVNKFMVRHYVKPGITGLAQIKGYRGGTEEPYMMEGRVKYDIWYLENWSFVLDMKIVFLTVWNMITGEENAF